MAGIAGCCRLAWLHVRGFKSLRDVRLQVSGGFTVLVGPNGSGKSALVESLLLLRDVLWYLRGRVVNPFQRWWGYSNVVWRGDETRPIELGVGLDCSGCSAGELAEALRERLDVEVPVHIAGLVAGGVEYWVSLSGAGGGFRVARERLCIQGFGCAILEGGMLTVTVEGGALRNIASMADEQLEIVTWFFMRLVEAAGLAEAFKWCASRVKDTVRKVGFEITTLVKDLFERGVVLGSPGLRSLLELYTGRLTKRPYSQPVSIHDEAEALVPEEPPESLARAVAADTGLQKAVRNYLSCIAERSGVSLNVDQATDRIVKNTASTMARLLLWRAAAVFYTAALVVGMFIDGVRVVRLLDYRAMRQPRPLEPEEALLEDGSNLVTVLFNLGRGRLPDEVAAVVAAVLGVDEVAGFFEATADGRLVLRLVVDGLPLAPPSVPEGAWKAMALMAAALSGATVLAVDEFENSLHAAAQELLLEELRRSVPTVIVATHSPTVVDAARSLEEIAVVELEAGETRVKRVADPERLAEKLRRLGLTPSEALLYGLLETAEERGSSGP